MNNEISLLKCQQVRDLENQLAEERKTRLKQESRALANLSTQSSSIPSSSFSQSQMMVFEKKPPLAPSKMRLPLRGITNLMRPPSPVPPAYKIRNSMITLPANNKENASRTSMAGAKGKPVLKARRGSIAVRPSPAASNQAMQPKRRASIATLHMDQNANMATPLNRSNARFRTDRVMGRQSFVWDPQRVWRTSRVQSPLPQQKEMSSATVEETPVVPRRSSKFMGSPPSQQVGSWKPKHPTVVALQKKQLIWSPLKMKAMKNSRKSLLS